MGNLWDSIKGSAESLGGAIAAPAGAVIDIAQMPFDDKDDDFGSVIHALSSKTANILDPVVNPQDGVIGHLTQAMEAANWAWQNGVSEPVATANMVNRHAFGGFGNFGPIGWLSASLTGNADWGAFADPHAWSEAYKRANQQPNALGAAFAYGALNPTGDPLAVDNPYKTAQDQHGALATGLAWTGEIAGSFVGDPTAAALKGVGAARGVLQYGKLNTAEKSGLFTAVTEGSRSGKLRLNLQSRTDKYLDWIHASNPTGRPLSAPEIYHGTPELQRYAKDPQAVAGFLADANKIADVNARRDVQRRILAVAGGDLSQVARIRTENAEAATIADQLSNMAREGVIDLDALAVAPTLAQNPLFRLRLENQLSNLNKDGSVDKFIDDFTAYNNRLLETQKSLPNLPGAHMQGGRAVNRLNDQGLARAPKNTLDDWSAQLAQRAQSTSTVFQKGKYSVPLVAVKTVGLLASPWTKAPVAVSDALRQTHFTGIASIHDWGSSTAQLDSMMRLGRVDTATRNSLLTEAYTASTESAKQAIIEKAERASMHGLARWASERTGRTIDSDYITELMVNGARSRSDRLTSLQGRVYATTEADPAMAARLQSAGRIEDATALAGSRGFSAKTQGKWRLDQINDDGTPLALPVFETQLGNHIPLFDVDLARKSLERDTGHLSRLSRAWKEESKELDRLAGLKAAGATGLDDLIKARAYARDWLVDMGQTLLRGWKFSVLFRLGYPIRVLTDDHLRIMSKIGAASFYGPNLKEFGGNLAHNLGRGHAARAALHDLKVRRQQILDELSSNEMTVHFSRQADLEKAQRALAVAQKRAGRLRSKLEAEEQLHLGRLQSKGAPRGYHGTRERFPDDRPLDIYSAGSGASNLYGHGFYTTDTRSIAATYQRKGGATESQLVYGVRWKGDGEPKLLDLDDALHPTVRQWAEQQLINVERHFDATEESFDEVRRLLDSGATSGEVIRAVRGMYGSTGEVSRSAVDDMVSILSETLADEGFDGSKHIGGVVTGGASHRVSIYFDTSKISLAPDEDTITPLRQQLAEIEGEIAQREASRDYLLEQLGDYGPTELKRELDEIEAQIAEGTKALRSPKRKVGDADIELGDGMSIPGAFGGEYGDVMRAAAGSGNMYDHLLDGAEARTYRSISGGSHRTIQPDELGHLDAWADVLNNQVNESRVGKFFLEGGTPEEFARWIKQSEQADLRRRVAHFAADPQDWGNRAYGIVRDYVPSEEVRQALLSGRVTAKQLRDVPREIRPSVHGRTVADNLGTSHAMQAMGRGMNRLFRALGETPTNVLSRHPYFNSLYKIHAKDFYAVRKASGVREFTQADVDEISNLARKAALRDLKTTLFELSAHSHAAQVMRFISPFFGAHQEGVMRWWRIAADKPQIIRRFAMVMDVPRQLGIEVDENGDLVKPGAPLSSNHRILLQLPKAFGGPDPEKVQSTWSINESAFNIILQGGLTNPGTGPLVSVPMDWAAQHYADDPAIARVARIFNPYPANNPLENVFPATGKRLSAYIYGKTGVDPSLGLGIGKREYNAAFSQNVQDAMVKFQLDNGREPTRAEADDLVEKAGAETTSQMFHRLLWNGLSPAPAAPRSKYAVIQQGWYKIQEQARAEGKDFDWAYEKFKAKYSEAYLPLIFSTSNNPAWVDANAADVAAIKHYKPLLERVDPAIQRMIIGPYADDLIAKNKTLGDYSVDARNYLRSTTLKPGSDGTYYSYDEPAATVDEQMARRGWQKYGELTAALTAQATAMGLSSYEDSPQLVAMKAAGVQAIEAENYAWADEWKRGFDAGQYDRYLDDMRQIVADPALANDAERTDIKTVKLYLELRDFFSQVFDARKAAGYGGFEAQGQDQVRQVYTALIHKLVESNTYFEEHDWNGLIERDPYLVRAQ